jgi:hypothetical protein
MFITHLPLVMYNMLGTTCCSLANRSDSASGSMNVNNIATTSGDVNPSISGHGMC